MTDKTTNDLSAQAAQQVAHDESMRIDQVIREPVGPRPRLPLPASKRPRPSGDKNSAEAIAARGVYEEAVELLPFIKDVNAAAAGATEEERFESFLEIEALRNKMMAELEQLRAIRAEGYKLIDKGAPPRFYELWFMTRMVPEWNRLYGHMIRMCLECGRKLKCSPFLGPPP